jgi:hypothetical protein
VLLPLTGPVFNPAAALAGAEMSRLLPLSVGTTGFFGVMVPLARLRARPRRSRIWARACSRDMVGVMPVRGAVSSAGEARGMVVVVEMVWKICCEDGGGDGAVVWVGGSGVVRGLWGARRERREVFASGATAWDGGSHEGVRA